MTIDSVFSVGPFPLAGIQCNSWGAVFCTVSGIPTYVTAVLTNNVWSVIFPCPVGFGTCNSTVYAGSATCTGTGMTITLNNTGTISVACPATLVVTLAW